MLRSMWVSAGLWNAGLAGDSCSMTSATSNASVDVQEAASYEAAKIMQQIRNRHIDKVTGKQVSRPSRLMQL